MNILLAGDFCQKNRIDRVVKERRFGELFDDIKPIVEQADYSIVNFEFPIVLSPSLAKPIKKSGPNLKGTIEAVDAIKYAGFKCCTLANNHILDQGEQSCIDTKNELEKAGIDTVGAGENIEEASKILYKEINGETLAIINCCEKEWSIATESSAGANPLEPILQYYKIQEAKQHADYVLVIVHGGIEHYQLPSPEMVRTYRFFIDAGADAVVNHHQHCYSGYEEYRGKPIFYALGNLCFDNLSCRDSIWNKGYMASITFDKNETQVKYELIPYSQCEEDYFIKLDCKKIDFLDNIKKLNAIICDKKSLTKKWVEYEEANREFYTPAIVPYHSRVLAALYRRKLLPIIFSNRQGRYLFDVINCESHRKRFLSFLLDKIK